MSNETTQLLAEIRGALAQHIEEASRYRGRCVEDWPEDHRNVRSAEALHHLADEIRTNDVYDGTPALRKLLHLVTAHDMTDGVYEAIAPSSESDFNASHFRFHDSAETEDEYLSRFADAIEEEWEAVDVA